MFLFMVFCVMFGCVDFLIIELVLVKLVSVVIFFFIKFDVFLFEVMDDVGRCVWLVVFLWCVLLFVLSNMELFFVFGVGEFLVG